MFRCFFTYQLINDGLKFLAFQSMLMSLCLTTRLECPSSCKCEEFGGEVDKRILVTGEDLLNVPHDLPTNVGAVYVTFGVLLILVYSNSNRLLLYRDFLPTRKLKVRSSCFSKQLIFFLCV